METSSHKDYGLIGYPLGHSFSAAFFNSKFRCECMDASYRLFPIDDISKLPELISDIPGLAGLNVTIPYKESVIGYLDSLSEGAREIGAVNVVKIIRNSCDGNKVTLIGFNTDAPAFADSLRPLLNGSLTSALVLGTGGASKAVEYALKKFGINCLKVSRNPVPGQIGYDNLTRGTVEKHRLIVNTTPLGMYPDVTSAPDIPYEYVTSCHVCYDLVYNPEVTEFMKRCCKRGAIVKNGLEMLYLQADKAWEIWNDMAKT